MIKLILVRHGMSEWNKQNRFTGWTDVDLASEGEIEAINAGKLLKQKNVIVNIAFTSVLKRAIKTLEFIKKELNQDFLVVKDYRLNERHYGALQGLNKQETAEKYGDKQVMFWRRSADVRPPLLQENDERNPKFDPLYKDVKQTLPLGENLIDTKNRVVECYTQLIKSKLQKEDTCLIVAHGNSLRALMQYLDNISNDDIMNLNIPTGTPIVYELTDDFKVLRHYYL